MTYSPKSSASCMVERQLSGKEAFLARFRFNTLAGHLFVAAGTVGNPSGEVHHRLGVVAPSSNAARVRTRRSASSGVRPLIPGPVVQLVERADHNGVVVTQR